MTEVTRNWQLRDSERIITGNADLLGKQHFLVALTRVRNEALLLPDTLDYLAKHVDAIVAYDDAGTDRTVEFLRAHPKVALIVANQVWEQDVAARKLAEGHKHFAHEIASILQSRRQRMSSSTFPTEFTCLNDVGIDHIAPLLLQHQRYLMGVVSAASAVAGADREMKRVLAKLAVTLREHADVLEDLLARREKRSRADNPGTSFRVPEPEHVEDQSLTAATPQCAA